MFEDAFTAAIKAEYALTFFYVKDWSNPKDAMLRTFSPWEVSDGTVLGWDHDRGAIRRFVFDNVPQEPVRYDFDHYVRPS
jgi:predicted DNA-binding transcriptional regulator YafY